MKSADSTIMYNIPVVAELNRVPNFDPMKFLRATENGPKLDLKYKKLWFRLKYPQGRIRVSNLRITDQLAIIEARVFFDRKDTESVANYTVTCDAKSAPDGEYIRLAQDLATDRALSDAGFGIQFTSADSKAESIEVMPQSVPTEKGKRIVTPTPIIKEETVAPVPEHTQPAIENAAPSVTETATILEDEFEEIIADIPDEPSESEVKTVSAAAETDPEETTSHTAVVSDEQKPVQTAPTAEIVREIPKVAAEQPTQQSAPAYTKNMSVEDICAVMSLEEAENYVVSSGACAGQKLSQVADRRPASLRFYMNGYKGDDNILRAAATLITSARPELLAG
ncbi:MAG: hypothetical protein ACI3XQ_05065 [Eubacteriales bacterium]